MAEKYANPDVLVETDWVAERLQDPKVRIVESDEDYLLYDTGHLPGAVKIDWFTTFRTRCAGTSFHKRHSRSCILTGHRQ